MGSADQFGPYVVYEQIGLGGMATVHRAETQGIAGFSKQVALKRMLPNVASDANLVKSFIREARLASHLRHANVAQTYDLGKVGETYFIAMELVAGRNLREILKHCAATRQHMPVRIAISIVSQICDALDYAHNLCDESGKPLGIIHRDVSPSNVILGEGGIVKLIDFGIAKASSQGMQTQSGTIKGKFGYMAPEYLMGEVDWRGDIFAVGVIAHELLSNKPLFQGRDDMDTLYRVKDMPILPPSRMNPQVPIEIDNVLMTALERDPSRRWQQASALRQALTTVAARAGLLAQNHEIDEWIDSAFTGAAGDHDSGPVISMGGSTMELSKGSVPDDFLGVAADSMQTMVRPSGSQPIQAQGTPIAKDDSPTLTERPSRQMPAAVPRAASPKPRPSQNLVPRGEFGDAAPQNQDWHDGATRADASAVDEVLQNRLARRDDGQRTIKGAGVDDLAQRTLVEAPPPGLLQQSFAEETVANAEAMRSLAESPLARDESLDSPTLTKMQRASTAATDPDGVAAKVPRDEFDKVETKPRRPTPLPQAAQPYPDSAKIRDDIPTTDEMPPRRDSPPPRSTPPPLKPPPTPLRTKLGVDPAPPPPLIPPSGARTTPHLPKSTDGASAIVDQVSVADVLADLGHRPTVPTPAKGAPVRPMAPKSGGLSLLLLLLVLIVAGGAAAVVYFALPYFT